MTTWEWVVGYFVAGLVFVFVIDVSFEETLGWLERIGILLTWPLLVVSCIVVLIVLEFAWRYEGLVKWVRRKRGLACADEGTETR